MKKFLFLAVALIMSVCGAWAQTEPTFLASFDFNSSGITAGAASADFTANNVTVTVATSNSTGLGSGTSTYSLTEDQLTSLNTNVYSTSAFSNDAAQTYVSAGAKNASADLTITISGLTAGDLYNVSLVTGLDFEGAGTWNSVKSDNACESSDPELGTESIQVRALNPYVITSMLANSEGKIVLTIDDSNGSHTAVINALAIALVGKAEAKTYTVHVTGATGSVSYDGTDYTDGQTITAPAVTVAELTAAAVEGYTVAVTIDGTDINVVYTALPFKVGQTYSMTLRGKNLYYDIESGLIKATTEDVTGNDALFVVGGNATDGYTFYSVGAEKYFYHLDTTTDKSNASAEADETEATRYEFVHQDTNGCHFKLLGTANNYINDRDDVFSTWNSTGGRNDAGGAIVFTEEELEPVADLPFTVGKKYVVWFNNADKQYFWEDKDGVANEIRCADGDINSRNDLETYSSTAYWTMGGDATNGYTFTNTATGKHLVAPATLGAGAAFLLSDTEATGFDVVKMENGYYRFYIHGQTVYYLAHTSRNSHLVTMYNVATYGMDETGGASVVQFEEIPDSYNYTLTLVDAPEGAVVTIGGETRANGATFSSTKRISTGDISVVAEGYTYNVDITSTDITITFAKIPYTVGKKYVISSVAHVTNDAVYYLTNDGTNTKLARTTEYPTEDQYWTAESVNLNDDGSINVSFVNNGKYFAFMATTTEAGHSVKLTKDDVDDASFVNIQDNLNYWPDKSTDTRFLYLAVKDDNTNIGWGSWQGNKIRTDGYSYQFKVEEIAEEEEPVSYTEGDFYVKNEASGKYFGFVGTSTSDGNFGPVEEADKLVCTVSQPEEGTFNIQLFGFNYVSCGSNGGFSNNKAANALQLFKVNGSSAVKATTIEEGAEYLIVGNKNGTDYALSNGTNGKTGADLRTAGIAVTITDNTISTVFGACKWTFEHYVNTDTREALSAVYIKNGEGKFFGIGGEGDDINILDEGQTWNIAPVTADLNAYTLENAEIDATKRFVNTGSHGYTSKSEDYNAKNVYFYELTDAATGTCTLVAQPELGKTYAMVIKNVNDSYAGYYAIYSGLALNKIDRGDVIALGTEMPATVTITDALSSSNGAITPAKALWTLTDTAEEEEPVTYEAALITADEINALAEGESLTLLLATSQKGQFSSSEADTFGWNNSGISITDDNLATTNENTAANTDKCRFVFTKTAEGFTIQNKDGKYVGYSGSTIAVGDTPMAWRVVCPQPGGSPNELLVNLDENNWLNNGIDVKYAVRIITSEGYWPQCNQAGLSQNLGGWTVLLAWNVTEEEPVGPVEPEYGATITAVFPNGNRHVVYSDGTKLTAAAEGNLPEGAISLFEIVSHEGDNIVLKAGDKYLHWTSGDNAQKSADQDGLNEEYDETLNTLTIQQGNTTGLQSTTWETTAIASLYELLGQGTDGNTYNFTLREKDDNWIAGNAGSKFFDSNWDGVGCRTSYFEIVLNEEPVGPVEPEEGVWTLASEPSAPVAGKTYALKNVSRNNYATTNGVQTSFNKEADDAIWSVEATGNTVDGAPTYYLFNKAKNAYWKNDDFEGNPGLDGYDIHNYCGTNADWTSNKTEAMEVTVLAAGSDATWRTAGAGSEGYIFALNRVVPDGAGGDYYFKLGQQGTDLAMEPWDEDVAWYFYEATFGEEPVGPIEPEFPLTGQPYLLKEKDSGMYLNVIPDSEDNKKDVVLKKKGQDLYFTAVEGGYTITTAEGLYVGGFSNGWNMSSKVAQTWVVEEVEGGYALRTADAGKYLGFDNIENEGAAAFRDKNYATNHGIFEFELNVFPAEGKAYQFKEKDSGMFLNVIPDSQDNKKDVILKKTAQALYFTAVEGGYTIATEGGLYVGASPANGWNMSSLNPQTWVVEEVEGGYALRTADAGKYLGFDTVDNEGAAAYRDKNYATNHGIFEITAYGTAELTAKDKLAAAIEEAKTLNTTDVPEDLVAELKNAIEMAEGVLNDAAATDADYDEARGILEHAANAVKNYVPQTAAEMFADLQAALEQARAITELNKVEGAINETTYEYELTSTLAGKVGYKTLDEVFNVAEDIAVIEYLLNLAGNDADALEALLNEQGESIRMYTAELVDLIAAYEAAGWVLPEKGKTYIIRSAPDQYSWTFLHNEGTLATAQWSAVKEDLTADYAWTCTGLEDYNIVNADLEVENLGQRVRFTSLAHPELYLCWKNVTDNAKAGNSYWQISGKNAPQYGAMSLQAFDGSNHYKYLTLQVGAGGAGEVGSMNHGDNWSWVTNSAYSSWYVFEEVDPNQFEDIVGIGTVIAPTDNALRFNIQGQRIAKDVRGINIVNGKKLIRK